MPNRLIHSTSPYLLQHANNPVDWHPWGEEALNKAVSENKLMVISIGYSSCHWCHVMEHDSFENDEVAEIMNRYFVCIKVDREERPDIDTVYMTAVQLMSGRGGWPLNCITLPDGRPVYGGTFFPREQWINILLNLANGWQNEAPRFIAYADELTAGIVKSEQMMFAGATIEHPLTNLAGASVKQWIPRFDRINGGTTYAPKFPMPSNLLFLLRHAYHSNDATVRDYVYLTLKKMAYGGIFDHLGGGFARYSVDAIWKVPHFEKMLYDNAQLVSLYSEAYRFFKEEFFRETVLKILQYIRREMTGDEGNFYSALDADSEGEEGKYYTWEPDELREILGTDYELFAHYYNVNKSGLWEHGRYILLRHENDKEVAEKFGMTLSQLKETLHQLEERLLQNRAQRIRPGLDDKTLASWNALMTSGYLEAYNAFGDESSLLTAQTNLEFILSHMKHPSGGLYHSWKNGQATITGFLEDYAWVIHALIEMYRVTFEVHCLTVAEELTNYVIRHFDGASSGTFFFTSDTDPSPLVRTTELYDNVVPSSNAAMALNLFRLGHYIDKPEWKKRAEQMVQSVAHLLEKSGGSFSYWLIVLQHLVSPLEEAVICGEEALRFRNELAALYLPPEIFLAGCTTDENIPVTRSRLVKGKTLIYQCTNHTCRLPVEDPMSVRFS